jgi:hypothetical protein
VNNQQIENKNDLVYEEKTLNPHFYDFKIDKFNFKHNAARFSKIMMVLTSLILLIKVFHMNSKVNDQYIVPK